MRRLEEHTVIRLADGECTKVVHQIDQPLSDWLRALLIGNADKLTWKVPIFKQVWDFFERCSDRVGLLLHKRSCNNDCGVWYMRLPDDPPGPYPTDEAHSSVGCTRVPFGARWDCWVYDQTHRNIKYLKEYTQV